LLIRGG
jgi:hypothetical protein